MDFIPAQCAVRSLGPANDLLNLLIQTLIASYCTISDPGWPPNCENPTDGESFDFIIVGAGTSGSVVANRLSENPKFSVLVLEAGGDPPVESEIPGLLAILQKSDADWQYYATSKHGCLATTKCYWPRGKMLGGSSAMNYMVYGRGNKKNYDYWEELGNDGWNYENVLKYMKRWEGNRNPCIANYAKGFYHNQTGPNNVSLFEKDPNSRIFLKAAEEVGNPHILDINANKTLGYLHSQGFIYDGVRQSAAKSYLIPAKNRRNLCIRKMSHVFQILFDEHKRAIGVKYNYNGTKNFTVYARKEIILSAGVIGSAQLLLLSGIGPKHHLKQLDIEVISDLAVGENLIDHVCVLVFFKFNGKPPSPNEALDDGYNYFIHRNGPLSSIGIDELNGFVNTKHNSRWPDAQYGHLLFTQNSAGLPGFLQLQNFTTDIQEKLVKVNKKYYVGAAFVVLSQPKSTGTIKLKSTSYTEHPIIDANYFDHPEDEETMIRAVELQIAFEKTKTFRKLKGQFISLPICNEFDFRSKSYLRCYNRHMSITFDHLVGTSKMGPKSDRTSVVNRELLIRGVKSLSQADMGIAPYTIAGSMNAVALMIGEKASDLIKRRN